MLYHCLSVLALNLHCFSPIAAFVANLTLKDLSYGHTVVGEDVRLECSITAQTDQIQFEWNAPLNLNLTSNRTNTTITVKKTNSPFVEVTSQYVIYNSTLTDSSIYYCKVSEKNNSLHTKFEYIWVQVYEPDEHVLEFHRRGISYDVPNLQISLPVRAHPNLTVSIRGPQTKMTLHTRQSRRFTNYIVVLKFTSLSRKDFGDYTLVANDGIQNKSFDIPVNFTGVPMVQIISDFKEIRCKAVGFPKPTIDWNFYPCHSFSSCLKNDTLVPAVERNESKVEDHGLQTISYIAFDRNNSGLLRCVAGNSFGQNTTSKQIFSLRSDFEIYTQHLLTVKNTTLVDVLYNETIDIVCGVSVESYFKDIIWYKESESLSLDDPRIPIKGYQEFKIKDFDTVYSSISTFNVDVKSNKDAGRYTCKAFKKDGTVQSRSLLVRVREQSNINIDSNMHNKTVDVEIAKPWRFYCNPDAFPTPIVRWFKNNKTLQSSERVRITDDNQTLAFSTVEPEDEGEYACEVSNRLHSKKIKSIQLVPFENHLQALFISLGVLLVALVVVSAFVVFKWRKDKKFKEELYQAGLTHFQEGALEQLNPKMRLSDQANLLPYDTKWEIPIENIKLGSELGSGAFGVVLKAEISGLTNDTTTITAAVKMIDKFAGFQCVKALASELKILVHLGKHLNIVNLIGACTKDVAKRKLLVVVEYCPYGNLQDYLLCNAKNFVDQRDKEKKCFEWTSDVKLVEDSAANTIPTSLCSRDLLIWAFQITQGMEYLASRRVLHGDLAARNVLLAEGSVVKISDFGLSKSVYKDGIYKKKEDVPLPVKWMAIESIGQKIFSTQSDVWSFGVVLWELFSLGRTPYPGMPIDQTFYEKLVLGYRMDSPELATKEVYETMMSCWNLDPMTRPSFSELGDKFGRLLEERVKNHYLDMNKSFGGNISSDNYLLMMSPPNYENILSSLSRYVNLNVFGCKNIGFDNEKTDADKK